MNDTDPDASEVIDRWQNAHGHRFGESVNGIERFEKFLIHLGYGSENPRFIEDEPIKGFLIDNPGVFEKIFEWIAENATQEQVDNLVMNGELEEVDEDNEDDLDPDMNDDNAFEDDEVPYIAHVANLAAEPDASRYENWAVDK